MTRVLVTGGAGFIGSHLVEKLLEQGHDVSIVDNLSSGSRGNLARAGKARLIVGDVMSLPELEHDLAGIELIYHFAALISSQDSLRQPEEYLETNLTGTSRVIQTAARIGARRIVFASSSTVYGSAGDALKREADLPNPLTVYALTKLGGEHLLSLYAPIHGFTHTSLRMFNVYGPRQSPTHPYANVTCKFAHAAAGSKTIDVIGDGEQSRDFVFVDDVVRAFLAVAEGSKRPVYNVGSGVSRSINDLIRVVEREGGMQLTRRDLPPWPNDIRTIRADVERFADDHGFRAMTSIDEGIARTIAFFKEQSR